MESTGEGTVASSVLDLIGNTPMVRLNSVTRGLDCEILAKLEYMNPSGSIKDRIALRMIESAEKKGLLKPGHKIVEASTGNTGISLSLVATLKGYEMIVLMPKHVASRERTKMMECYGAQIKLIDPETVHSSCDTSVHGGLVELTPRVRCRDMEARGPNVWWARQFNNPDNVAAHRQTTGKEILRQTKGRVDAFVASVGTGGTLMGVAEALRPAIPQVQIVAVEPAGTPLLAEGRDRIPIIEGISDGLLLDILDSGLVDEVIRVTDEEAIAMAHQLAQKEALFCGISSGANVFAALDVAGRLGEGTTIVTVLPDSRDRYLSTERYIT